MSLFTHCVCSLRERLSDVAKPLSWRHGHCNKHRDDRQHCHWCVILQWEPASCHVDAIVIIWGWSVLWVRLEAWSVIDVGYSCQLPCQCSLSAVGSRCSSVSVLLVVSCGGGAAVAAVGAQTMLGWLCRLCCQISRLKTGCVARNYGSLVRRCEIKSHSWCC